MLNKIIEETVFEVEQQKKTKELQLKTKKQRIDELNQEIQKLTEKLESIIEEYSSLSYPVIKSKKDYSFFERVFKNSYKTGLKEYNAKIKEYQEKRMALLKSKDKVKSDLAILESENDRVSKDLDVLKTSIDKIEVQLKYFNDKNNIIKHIVETKPELCKEKEFMLELIQHNILNIIYDKSNDVTLYINFFEIILENIDLQDYKKNSLIKIIKELKEPVPSIAGFYNIPIKYMFEAIRNAINSDQRYSIDYIMGSVINVCNKYIDLNNVLPIQYAEELQNLWEDESVRIGVHAFGDLSVAHSIFKKGLRCSQQQKGDLDLRYTSYVQKYNWLSFLSLLDYNTMVGSNYIVIALPEACFNSENKQPIWGSHNPTVCGEEYILPQYILGVVPGLPLNSEGTELDFSKKIFCHNDCSECESYEYFFENGYDSNSVQQRKR